MSLELIKKRADGKKEVEYISESNRLETYRKVVEKHLLVRGKQGINFQIENGSFVKKWLVNFLQRLSEVNN